MLCTRLFAPPAPAKASAPSSSAIVRSPPTGISGSVKLVAKSPHAAPSVAITTAITTNTMIKNTIAPINFSTVW